MTATPSATRKASAPRDLGDAGRKLWNDIARQVAGDGLELDATEKRVLHDACVTADDVERLQIALKSAPVVVVGSAGQEQPNRLFDEVRKGRALIASLLKQLDLTDPETKVKGTGSRTTSATARAAASVRWGRGTSGVGSAH